MVQATVQLIEARKPGDPLNVCLSNFRVYEDRLTHEFVLTMPRLYKISATDSSSPAYECRFHPE